MCKKERGTLHRFNTRMNSVITWAAVPCRFAVTGPIPHLHFIRLNLYSTPPPADTQPSTPALCSTVHHFGTRSTPERTAESHGPCNNCDSLACGKTCPSECEQDNAPPAGGISLPYISENAYPIISYNKSAIRLEKKQLII